MSDRFEIKVKMNPGTDWENLPVVKTFTGAESDCERLCQRLARGAFEVRYNRAGMCQGHYVSGSKWGVA